MCGHFDTLLNSIKLNALKRSFFVIILLVQHQQQQQQQKQLNIILIDSLCRH